MGSRRLGNVSTLASSSNLNPVPSEPIGGIGDTAMDAITTSLAVLRDSGALASSIPYIGPVAGLLLQVLAMRSVSFLLFSWA